jgi:hypothetical protein
MNTKISMFELENQLNEFLKNVKNNSSVSLIENYKENKLYIERQHLSNKPIINPIPNITIGEVFLIDMSNATPETINDVKSNTIRTHGLYQCVCDSITINNYNPKVIMEIRIASIDVHKITLEYYIDTFDCNYTLCLYDKDNKKIGRYNKFSIKKANKSLLYVDKYTKGDFYEIGAISFDVLKAFVVSQYFDVVQYNGELYHTTCKWNGVKPTAFKSKFVDICCIKLTKEGVEIHLYNEDKWRKLEDVKRICYENELNELFYYTYKECAENNSETIVCFEEKEKEPEKPQVIINIEINNIHKTFNICDVKDVMEFIKSQA